MLMLVPPEPPAVGNEVLEMKPWVQKQTLATRVTERVGGITGKETSMDAVEPAAFLLKPAKAGLPVHVTAVALVPS